LKHSVVCVCVCVCVCACVCVCFNKKTTADDFFYIYYENYEIRPKISANVA